MIRRKVLYVCHNHPSLFPGGAEIYAVDLYRTIAERERYDAVLLARQGPNGATGWPHNGVRISRVNGDGNQYFIYTDPAELDYFIMSPRDKQLIIRDFREFLQAQNPDVVHFQHLTHLGYDFLRETRNVLPDAPILYTLHEFLPICHREGQMVRVRNQELCDEATPARCHGCFPERSPADFFLRKRFIQSQFAVVDLFLAPSEFLRQRYIAWGIPEEKVRFSENGRRLASPMQGVPERRQRNRLGFFGQFGAFKGLDVLLKAMRILSETRSNSPDAPHLWLHGSNLEHAPETFQREIRDLLSATSRNVSVLGRYEQSEMPRLAAEIDWIVVPSIWWENSPLVIQEAFWYRRPVICSDIGGMAEKVANGVNGLHFRVKDPISLAKTLNRATEEAGLWDKLVHGIPQIRSIEDDARVLAATYDALLAAKARQNRGAQELKLASAAGLA